MRFDRAGLLNIFMKGSESTADARAEVSSLSGRGSTCNFTKSGIYSGASYRVMRGIVRKGKRNPKAERLKENDSLNLHPERVRAERFQHSTFFDPLDLVQVKYEMLREVSHEGASKVQATASYGLSRQAFYQALNAFTLGGIAGLLPGQRGPKGAHKLTDEVMAFIEQRQAQDPGLHARALAKKLLEELHLVVHPRSIERALARKKKR